MSDKPVYQRHSQYEEWQDITEEEFERDSLRSKYKTRILYPSAAYEALKAENEKLKAHYEGALDSIREHQQICNALKAENEKLKRAQSKDAVDYWDLVAANADRAKQIADLKAENKELRHVNLTSLADLHFKNRELESKNKALVNANEQQAKRIAELEKEAFALSAGQCIHQGSLIGDDRGNQFCTKHYELLRIKAANAMGEINKAMIDKFCKPASKNGDSK